MIIGIGTDIVEISRIESAVKKDSFLNRYFTAKELELFSGKKAETIAGNFAAKEAVAKAMGTGFSGFGAEEIEILRDERGRPFVNLYGNAEILAQRKNITVIHISISHSGQNAVAFAVSEGEV